MAFSTRGSLIPLILRSSASLTEEVIISTLRNFVRVYVMRPSLRGRFSGRGKGCARQSRKNFNIPSGLLRASPAASPGSQ